MLFVHDFYKGREAITAQSDNLFQDFLILPNLVLNDSSHRAKQLGTIIDKGQKFSSKLWPCADMAARLRFPFISLVNYFKFSIWGWDFLSLSFNLLVYNFFQELEFLKLEF